MPMAAVATMLGLMLLLGGVVGGLRADAEDAETDGGRRDRILIEAVEAASGLDFYNARCRGDLSGRHTDNLNKLLVSRQRTTVLRVKDERFPEHDYRRVQERLEAGQQDMLNAAGGCQEARKTDLPGHLRERHETAMQAVRSLP